jgi:hypothetical protein
MTSMAGGGAFLGGLTLVVPALIAKFIVGATWPQVALAFPIFWFLLAMGLGFGKLNEEVLGWTLIMAMFTSWLGVPIVGLVLRLTDIPRRFF